MPCGLMACASARVTVLPWQSLSERGWDAVRSPYSATVTPADWLNAKRHNAINLGRDWYDRVAARRLDWKRERYARREVHKQLRETPVARRVHCGIAHRALRRFFGSGTFGRFVSLYLVVNVTFVMSEALIAWYMPSWLPQWSASGSPPATDVKVLILNVSSYLLGAQVGSLGVISLSLALVTIIAQREGSSTDVQVYYHESMSFELVASCVALAAVLCLQLLWPLQFLLHLAGLGTSLQIFKLGLLGLHLAWLLVNLAAVANFIATTFRFVQQSARETLRERYTANVVLPRNLEQRLREQLYGLATKGFSGGDDEDGSRGRPSFTFGFDYGEPRTVEVETTFERPMALHDVRMTWVHWVFKRWSSRCADATAQQLAPSLRSLGHQGPLIWFTPHIDQPLRGKVAWCRRRGGVPLTGFEKFVLRRAFRFRSSHDED